MTKIQESVLTFSRAKMYEWAIFAVFISSIPLVLHQQWITGPIVNAILVAATFRLGAGKALTLAILPSAAALAAGTLPFVLAPTLPVIILGNMLLIAGVHVLQTKPILGVILGAGVKFIWLTIASQWILQFFLPEKFLGNIATMLSWPQLATALLGGAIALGILHIWKK